MFHSRLGKYRRPWFGALKKQYNTKLPKGLADDLEKVCEELNMSPPEFIRLLIYEEIEALKKQRISKDTQRYPLISNDIDEYTKIPDDTKNDPLVLSGIKEYSKIPVEKPTSKTKRKGKGQARSIQQWTIDNLVPCPLCDPPRWITRTNYARHVKKHGFNNGYELIQANLNKVEQMVQEKSE
jgi:hypothetical protein